jgi:hypothetical protein
VATTPTHQPTNPGPNRWIYLGAEIGCVLATAAALGMFVFTHLPQHLIATLGLGGCTFLYDRQRRRVTADPSQTLPGTTIGIIFALAAFSLIFLRAG